MVVAKRRVKEEGRNVNQRLNDFLILMRIKDKRKGNRIKTKSCDENASKKMKVLLLVSC